jgi:hypothetical protein
MAAGFIVRTLATLGVSPRWVEFANGDQAPVHGAVTLDSATGLPLDYSTPSPVIGDTATNVAPTTAPVRLGAIGRFDLPSPVTSGRTVDLVASRKGVLIVRPHTISDYEIKYAGASGGITTSGNTLVLAASGSANYSTYLNSFQFINTGSTATEFSFTDGSGGTVLWRGHAPANMTSMVSVTLPTHVKTTANVAMYVNVATSGAALLINAQGHWE